MKDAERSAKRHQWSQGFKQLRDASDALDKATYEFITAARADGVSWPQIAAEFGQSWQSLRQRYVRLAKRFDTPPTE